ncbi:hypothetical protein B0T22DRAFT_461774 [Podospora appendiculata]|uniref:Uncharacterized protein n=1 Tax=Podospora appendiculata TaxID=314037 RepID=A0AAE0XBB1_9PEZI|nr:hypothetical protein B0T22DRAFT_461774 [Podospora appendiculata]
MRFSAFASLALTLAVAVGAIPTPVPNTDEIAAREDSLTGSSSSSTLSAAVHNLEAATEARDIAAKYNPSKITLTFPKTLAKGSIPQNQREAATDLGKKAMFQAGVKVGTLVFGWHSENTEDPIEHFTINPSSPDDKAKLGKIHVHRDGSWTQGLGGLKAHGDGKV